MSCMGTRPCRHAASSPGPNTTQTRCDLDTGACYGGTLSAAFFDEQEAKPFHTISVE